MKTIYNMKYALTAGVEEVEVDAQQMVELTTRGYFKEKDKYNLTYARDVAYTQEEAEKSFEELRIKKLQSLDKQTKKYSALKFKMKRSR